ncbi:MAG: methionine--tRNA ligase [Clostridiales bacterium]|nr:methionine--tRNA ligase [Clostridiales bacterium]
MDEKKTFYITTPIYYPSATPHVGTAYPTVAADAMARYKRMRGYDAYFLTGTDEHGLKIQRRAQEAGLEPLAFVDPIVENFRKLWQVLLIDNDDFIRTTEDRHKKVAEALFQKIYDQGDIYKGEYNGWYCPPCETFFTERQLQEGHLCPDCGRPAQITREESYFFKMSKYAQAWLDFIEENPGFIQPQSRRNEMVNFVRQGLDDLCVSRTSFSWGIPVPFDSKHVIYVWFDALINYISALGFGFEDELYQKYWPADIHLVGKDIIRFHTVIWPIMLMAAGIPLPQKIIGHGWFLMGDDKMSKSKGNVVDPFILCQKYGADAVRYFLLREMGFGLDANYSEEALVNRINIDLANDYGNLLSRATAMINKFQGDIVLIPGESTDFDNGLRETAAAVVPETEHLLDNMELSAALTEIWRLVNKANKYIDDCAPWALNKAKETGKLASVLYNMAETVRLVTIMITPFMPGLPRRVWQQLGISDKPELHTWESLKWGLFPAGTKIERGEPLFPRIDPATLNESEEPAREKEEGPPSITIDDFAKMDLRIVKVLACEKVEKADKLLKFRLQMGDEERTVISGIAEHYQPDQLLGRNLVLIANLEPRKIRGTISHGMLLSAAADGRLEVLEVDSISSGAAVK